MRNQPYLNGMKNVMRRYPEFIKKITDFRKNFHWFRGVFPEGKLEENRGFH